MKSRKHIALMAAAAMAVTGMQGLFAKPDPKKPNDTQPRHNQVPKRRSVYGDEGHFKQQRDNAFDDEGVQYTAGSESEEDDLLRGVGAEALSKAAHVIINSGGSDDEAESFGERIRSGRESFVNVVSPYIPQGRGKRAGLLAACGAAAVVTVAVVKTVAVRSGIKATPARIKSILHPMIFGRSSLSGSEKFWDRVFTPAQLATAWFFALRSDDHTVTSMYAGIFKEKPLTTVVSLLGMGAAGTVAAQKAGVGRGAKKVVNKFRNKAPEWTRLATEDIEDEREI